MTKFQTKMGSTSPGRNPGPLVVEFVGLPGAGKSALASRLVASLSERGVSCGERKNVGGSGSPRSIHYTALGLFYLCHPVELRAALQLASTGSPRPVRRVYQAIKYVSVWSYRMRLARRRGYQAVVLDQGVVQDAWSLMLRGPWRDEIVHRAVSRAILATGLPYALVYFDIPVEAAVKRIEDRPTMESRFDRVEPVEATRQLRLQGNRLERLFTRIVDLTGAAHYRLDATQSLDDSCSELEAFVQALNHRHLGRTPQIHV